MSLKVTIFGPTKFTKKRNFSVGVKAKDDKLLGSNNITNHNITAPVHEPATFILLLHIHNTMSHSYDIRFLPLSSSPFGSASNAPAMILRFLQQFTSEGEYDDLGAGSHLPMVQPVRDLQRRVEILDAAATKYRNKSSESTSALQGDLSVCDDPEAKFLTEGLMRSQKMLADYLEGLHPILRDQIESVKRLSEYLTPPTVELFQKKANHILKDAPPQQISMTKKNTCTICMDATADCVIKRTCTDSPPSSSSHQQVRCERDTCKCGPTMCKDCLLTHYWTSTGKGSKSYARCVCCRAGIDHPLCCYTRVFVIYFGHEDFHSYYCH